MQLQAVQANQAACWRQHLRRFKRDYRRDRCEGLKLARDPSDGVERRSVLAEIWKQHNPYTSPCKRKSFQQRAPSQARTSLVRVRAAGRLSGLAKMPRQACFRPHSQLRVRLDAADNNSS